MISFSAKSLVWLLPEAGSWKLKVRSPKLKAQSSMSHCLSQLPTETPFTHSCIHSIHSSGIQLHSLNRL